MKINLINNQNIISRLLKMADGNLSHAYIISGPEGSGKKTLANFFASAILCHSKERPCGGCVSCNLLKSGNHPDIIYINPSGPAGIIKVDDIRSMRSSCYVKPTSGDDRVILINKAHTMNVNSQNALLKILEEPPAGTVFLLLTDRIQKLLPTILSRTVKINMALPERQALIEYLSDLQSPTVVTPAQAANFSEGIVGQAISLMESDNNDPYFLAMDFMKALAGNYLYDFLLLLNRLSKSREYYVACLNATVKLCFDICSFLAGNGENLHFEVAFVASIAKKLTKAKSLNIINILRDSCDTAENSAVDLRVLATNTLLQSWEEAHR